MQRLFVRYVLSATLIILGWSTVRRTHDAPIPSLPVLATSGESRYVTLFQNVRMFSGKGSEVSGPLHVLVRGNQIEKITTQPIVTDRRGDTIISTELAGR